MGAIEAQCRDVYVQPGESHLVRGPAVMHTLLGSCVGITFRHEQLELGALCHPMLPRHPHPDRRNPDVSDARRYVDYAIRDLAAQFDAMGAKRKDIEVKVFGGADVLQLRENHQRPTVGRLNREMALHVLREEGFAVAASRLGGPVGFHIDFDTTTGEVLLRRLG